MMNRSLRFFSLLLFLSILSGLQVHAQTVNLTISNSQIHTISDSIHWESGIFDNHGTLKIDTGGFLTIGSDVENSTKLSDPPRLDLAVADISGTINSDQTLVFNEGTFLRDTGSIILTDKKHDLYFIGPSTIEGSITANYLVINPSSNSENTEATVIDLSDESKFDVNSWVINGSAKMTGDGKGIQLTGDLNLGSASASLVVTDDLIVDGNYFGYPGATLVIKPDDNNKGQGSVVFKGGGIPDSDGYNNVFGQSSINAANIRLENKSEIASKTMLFQGNLVLGEDSQTDVELGFGVKGKLTLEENAILNMVGDSSAMSQYGSLTYGAYNGIFAGGFDLNENAVIKVYEDDQNLQLALGDDSKLQKGSSITGNLIHIAGTDSSGSSYVTQLIANEGTIQSATVLDLIRIEITTTGSGKISANSIKLANGSKLIFTNEGSEAALELTGEKGMIQIGEDSLIKAENKTIQFGSASVTNVNSNGGIEANIIEFGDKGRYEVGIGSSEKGAGLTKASAIFNQGSTLALNGQCNMDFIDNAVTLKEGSTIELNIQNSSLGSIVTTGKVTIADGVNLAIKDGSSFEGRTKTYIIAQGSTDSEYGTDLKLTDTLFFSLSNYGEVNLDDGKGNEYLGFAVEIIKAADLIDYAGSFNQYGMALIYDQLIANDHATDSQKAIYDALMQYGSDYGYRKALDHLTGSIRENAVVFALSSPWRQAMDHVGFHRLSLALERKSCSDLSESKTTALNGQMKSMLPKASMASRGGLSHDLWFNSFYGYDKLDSDKNTTGGEGHRGGFMLGSGLPTGTKEALLGLSFGYSAGQYKQSGDKVDLNDFQFGVYGGANLFQRNLQIRGYVGYGIQNYESERTVAIENLGTPQFASGDTDGTSICAAIMLIRPLDMSNRWMLKPTVGIDVERLEQDGFTETGEAAWQYGDVNLTRTMMRFGVTSDYTYRRAELTGRVFYGVKVAGDSYASSWHINPSNPAYGFNISSIDIGPSVVDIGFGGNFGLNARRTSLLFLDYNGAFGRNNNSHTASLGVLWKR